MSGLVYKIFTFVISPQGNPRMVIALSALKLIDVTVWLMSQQKLVQEHPNFAIVLGVLRSMLTVFA